MAPRKTKTTRKPARKSTKPKTTRPKRKAPKRKNLLSSLSFFSDLGFLPRTPFNRKMPRPIITPFNRTMLPNTTRFLERKLPQGRRLQFIGKG